MSQPFASIIVPTYNQAQYLSAALESILAQTDASWEAIIVDDGSTDDTPVIIRDFAQRDKRIVSVSKFNGGTSSALNLGLRYATGRWIHWLSSDDLFEPSKLAINRKWIERNPECKFFFSYFSLLHEATGACERRKLWGPIPHPEYQILTLLYRNYVNGISVCIDRKALMQVGGFDETLLYAQDFDLWIRLLKLYKAAFIPEWTVISRVHALQGSAVFSEACFFDTAMAAVKFLNTSKFEDLIPWTDLSNIKDVLAAIHAALDVAFDATSFLYGLGLHPGLVQNILHWTSRATEDPVIARIVKTAVEARIDEAALEESDNDFHLIWRKLAEDGKNVKHDHWIYDPFDPIVLGWKLHANYLSSGDPRSKPLAAYLRRFDNVNIPLSTASALDHGAAGQNPENTQGGLGGERQYAVPEQDQSPLQIEMLKREYKLLRAAVVRMSEAFRSETAQLILKGSSSADFSVRNTLRSELVVWYATILRSAAESLFKQIQSGSHLAQSIVASECYDSGSPRPMYESIDDAFDHHLVVASGLFDACAYKRVNDDVAQAQIDPLYHYLSFGGREGRSLGGGFDTELYLSKNRDVAEAGANPLVHFLRYGFLEGRGLECLKEVSDKIVGQ